MKKRNKVIKPNVVGGGVAIPLGNNFYFMRGRKHEFGGIDVGPNNKNGLEVEDGEVMQMGGKQVKVYSSLPILNGKSPAELVIAGLNPNKVFNAQERFKDINKLNDDGSRKAKWGIKKKLADKIASRVHADGFTGGTNGVSDAINQMILNKDGDPIRRIKEIDDVNTKVENGEPLSENEELIYKSDVFPRLDMIKQHKDALHLYLGKPQVYNTMEVSPYQGIVSKDKKAYQIKGVLSDNFFENNVVDDYAKWKSGGGKNVDDLGKTAQLHDIPYMNNAGMSEGYDKNKGHYISVFDTWDYNRKIAGKHGDNVGKFIGGKPFDLYHRFYLDEWNDIPEQYRGTKWLPDMVVKPNGHYTETMNIEDGINFDASSGGFKYGGKKHFTINGNVVNKAGYVPSTGELPKANLGTVASVDRHVTGKDKDNYFTNDLKRLGGMSKRQKAEIGKNIFSPRGLGVQATMTKMQADAWDKKHPGEYNPYAQQFIDNFGDPTIYSSIMSDDANARGFGIDRGYKGIMGLGWVMPELPNINLDNYFSAREDLIDGTDRSGGGAGRGGSARSGSGVSGGKRPEVKIEPLKLITAPKSKGVTVNPVKPPTQITIKTPKTETKNKGTWWKDNGSDLISGLAKGGASLASYLINRNMLNDLKYVGQPIFIPAAKLKTKININPQIDTVNRITSARNENISANTASSKVRNARMNNIYIDRLGYLNELYGMKENKETELINADKLNRQEIAKDNIKTYNDWVEKKQNFENTVREKESENAVSFVSNLASGVDDILTNRQKRKQFKQNIAAYMASHPNVSPELLESYGLDIGRLGLIKRTNSYKTRKKIIYD